MPDFIIAEDFTTNLKENRKASLKPFIDWAKNLIDFGSTSQVKSKLLISKRV